MALLMLALAACEGSSSTGTDGTGGTLRLSGRVERGNTVQVVLHDVAGAPVPGVTSVTITPATSGTVSGSTVTFTKAGAVTISATSGGLTATSSADVALPPTVFFDAIDQGNRDIYSVALDGQEARRWTTAAGDDLEPSVAAGQVLFASARAGSVDLYAIALSSGAERRVTALAGSESQPALSADGLRIAYANDASGLSRIWIAAADNAGAAALTSSSPGSGVNIEVNPRWSPTGDRILFTSTANGRANIFTAPSTAGALPSTVAGSTLQATDVEPAWSPDGNRVAFASTRAGGTSLFITDLRTGAVTALPNTTDSGQPVWLADGRIVFTRFAATSTSLAWIDPDDPASGVRTIPLTYTRPQHPTSVR